MNGFAAVSTYRTMPRAIRRHVAGASGRLRSKIDGHGSDQSMHSAAARHGRGLPLLPCVGSGQRIGSPSQRATRNRRLRVVGAPWSAATSTRCSTS
jgi:hypothetical protein